jgi:glycosyltransferase involved in cell wall biosynthesis
MRLLIVSFHYDAHPEGICTGRLVRALLDEGADITVVTSDEADTSFVHPRLTCSVIHNPRVPRLVFSLLNRIFRAPGSYVLWCRKVVAAADALGRHDLIYGRSAPISSAQAARLLAARLGRRYWTHYSDPFPMPWVPPDTRLHRRQAAYSRRLLGRAHTVTFTNAEALAYQERCLGIELASKSFVLQHVAPRSSWLPAPGNPAPVLGYIGTFYGRRTARSLLEAFALIQETSPGARFMFVGSDPTRVLPEAERLGLVSQIQVVPRTKDVARYMAAADLLVALDADYGEPVFITTKMIEYLMVNRPVLMITSPRSPGAAVVNRFPSTAVLVPGEDPRRIAEGMRRALALNPNERDYQTRFGGMEDFSASGVARRFLSEASRRIPRT